MAVIISEIRSVDIKIDDLKGPEIQALLTEHLKCMHEASPPESCHALDLAGLGQPEVTFWSVWIGPELAGCGALKELNAQHGEIKSMRTTVSMLGKGVASKLLQHIIGEAKRRGYAKLSLETGSMDYFIPARKLYEKFGFVVCGPFGEYQEDPYSTFMTKTL